MIFSDIMLYLKDCIRLSDPLVLPQQVRTHSGGYLGHGGEGIGGKESNAPLFRLLSVVCGLLQPEESSRSPAGGVRIRLRGSGMLSGFVVAGDVKRSDGGSSTTS